MEKEHFYKSDHYISKSLVYTPQIAEDERPVIGIVKTTAIPSGVKLSAMPIEKQQTMLQSDVLKPSIPNTGIYVPIVEKPSIVQTSPAVASGVSILAPNVPGGIAVKTTSPIVDELKKLQAASKAGIQGAIDKGGLKPLVEPLVKNMQAAAAEGSAAGNKLASLGLPSPLIIGGMIIAVIAFYFISKRNK